MNQGNHTRKVDEDLVMKLFQIEALSISEVVGELDSSIQNQGIDIRRFAGHLVHKFRNLLQVANVKLYPVRNVVVVVVLFDELIQPFLSSSNCRHLSAILDELFGQFESYSSSRSDHKEVFVGECHFCLWSKFGLTSFCS